MKRGSTAIILGFLAALSLGGSAFAGDKEDLAYWNNYDPIVPDKGEFTTDYPVASRILTSPFRAVTTVGGAIVGSVVGVGKGIIHAEMLVSQNTFERMPDEYGMLLAPMGVVGSVVAIPIGAVDGAVRGAGQGTISGFLVPEAY